MVAIHGLLEFSFFFHLQDSEYQGDLREAANLHQWGIFCTKTPMTRIFWQLCCWFSMSLGTNPCDFLASILVVTAVFLLFLDCFENLGRLWNAAQSTYKMQGNVLCILCSARCLTSPIRLMAFQEHWVESGCPHMWPWRKWEKTVGKEK